MRIALLGGVAAAALFAAGGLKAQTMLEPIVVEGAGDAAADTGGGDAGAATSTSTAGATGPVDGYVAKNTLTGSKTATPITEIPQSVSVVGREEIDDRGAAKVDEALRYTAGVFTQPFGADGDTNWLFIRGFDATQTGVYQDGLQLFSFAFGGFYIDSFAQERLEVLRGASSVLYGGSNPGGVVNYVSKRPDGERLRYLETGINDAGNAWMGIDIGDRASPALDYRVTARIAGGEGYTDFEDDFRGFIAPSFTWHVDQNTDFTVLANFTALDETHGGGSFLPYAGTVIPGPQGIKIDPEANFTEPGIDEYQRRQASIGYEFEHRFMPGWAVRQNFRYGYSDLHEVAPFTFGYATNDPVTGEPRLSRFDFEHESTVNNVLVDNQLEGRVQTGPVEHRFLFGSDYKWYQLDQLQLSGFGTPIGAVNPVYGVEQPDFAFITDQIVTLQQLGFYAQDQLRFGDGWIVTLGGRYDYVDIEAEGTGAFKTNDDQWSGRAGLAYEFKNGLTPYTSVSTFFNPQIANIGSGFTEPESGQQYEVGVKYAPKWFDGLITVAWFDLTKQNVLTGSFPVQSQVGEVNSSGLEFEVKANLTKELKLTAFATAFDLEITKDENAALIGNTPFLIPEQQAGIYLDYTFRDGMLNGFSVGAGVRYLSDSWADNENTSKVPSVTLYDAKLGYKEDNWGIQLNVSNLFDEEYVASCQTLLTCSYGEGRVVKLKTHVTW
jgi:iron complex outermembrane receptor protein